MIFTETEIKDIILIKPKIFKDKRGYFFESFREDLMHKEIEKIKFIQDNESKSSRGVLRGLHYQRYPFEQSKLVRVVHGKIFDVAVDIRKDSSTFGKWVGIELSSENKYSLFVPKGFAHGFLVLSDFAIVQYKVDNIYSKEHEGGINFNDPTIDIDWPIISNQIILSDKDRLLPFLNRSE